MVRTFYVVTNERFSDRDKRRFGYFFFESIGWKVLILDVSHYTNPELKLVSHEYHAYNSKNIIKCSSVSDIKSALIKSNKNDVAYLNLGDSYKDVNVRRILASLPLVIGTSVCGIIPTPKEHKTGYIEAIVRTINTSGALKLIKNIFNRIYAELFDIKKYDYMIVSNYNLYKQIYRHGPSAKKYIQAHAMDYDIFLELEKTKTKTKTKDDSDYVVFIDQYITRHNDFVRLGRDFIDEIKYFESLISFFKKVEYRFGVKIVIALHPKADNDYKSKFGGREVIYADTAKLVKNSRFVIMHDSTAINFVVLYNKPALFIYDNEYEKHRLDSSVKLFSKSLGSDAMNISNTKNMIKIPSINLDRYLEYKEKYIKESCSSEDSFWRIFYDEYIN
jgi:hypothetical protein